MKKPRVSKNISLTIYERVDLGVRLRPDRLSQFVQPFSLCLILCFSAPVVKRALSDGEGFVGGPPGLHSLCSVIDRSMSSIMLRACRKKGRRMSGLKNRLQADRFW
jgi:hypothetical protein